MIQRRKSLAILTRKRLLEVGDRLKISGLSGKTKDQIIESIAARRSVKIDQLLGLFRLEELTAACLKAGLDGGDRLLTREEAANYLGGLKPQTLAKWSCSGAYGLPFIKVGGSVRYRISDLEKFLVARTVNPAAAE